MYVCIIYIYICFVELFDVFLRPTVYVCLPPTKSYPLFMALHFGHA